MYQAIPIKQLSLNQAKNLVKGKGVRVMHDPRSSFKVNMSPQQIKKLSKAHRAGKGMTLTMDPYQQEITGQGIFGKKFDKWMQKTAVGRKIYKGVETIGKPLLKKAITLGTTALSAYNPAIANRLGAIANAYVDDPSKYNEGDPRTALMNLGRTAITGEGIFGDRVDRMVKRVVGQKGMDTIERVGRPLVSKGIGRVSQMLRSRGMPESMIGRMEDVAGEYVNNPSAYQSRSGVKRLGVRAMTGQGIFGSRVDRLVKKVVGQKGMDVIERVGRPLVTKGIKKVSGFLRSRGLPESMTDRFENVAEQYVDDPSAYQSRSGIIRLGQNVMRGQGVRRVPARRGRPRKSRAIDGGALFPAGRY
jgi:hypothetical protein